MELVSSTTQQIGSEGSQYGTCIDEHVRKHLCANYYDLRGYFRARVRTTEDADDLAQEFCVKVLRCSRQIRGQGAVGSWIAKALRTTLVDYYRRCDAERRSRDLFATSSGPSENPEREPHCLYLPRALASLKPEYADSIERIEFLGEMRGEAAEALGISVNAFTVRLFRARTALRKKLISVCRSECGHYGKTRVGCWERMGARRESAAQVRSLRAESAPDLKIRV